MRHTLLILAVVASTLLLAGCPSLWQTSDNEKPPSAEELFKKAEALYKDKAYDEAIQLYERLKSGHPDFEKMPQVYMRIADACFDKGTYEKAIARYGQFIELYPAHKETARAKYRVAMAYFKQILNTDLDSRAIHVAAEAFKELRDDPAAGEWAKKAAEKYDECLKKLAQKELYKARTYVSMGKYESARCAAKRVLEQYADLGFDKEANDLIKGIKGK